MSKLPDDVPSGSAEARRIMREMANSMLKALEGASEAKIVAAKPAPPKPPPTPKPVKVELPPDVPEASAEGRRLLKEAMAGSRLMIKEAIAANREMIEQAKTVAAAAQKKAVVQEPKRKPLVLPPDVPEDSAEGRTRLSDYKNKGVFVAPIKKVPFKPNFDNEPEHIHSVKM